VVTVSFFVITLLLFPIELQIVFSNPTTQPVMIFFIDQFLFHGVACLVILQIAKLQVCNLQRSLSRILLFTQMILLIPKVNDRNTHA